jgi:hypothetical protein
LRRRRRLLLLCPIPGAAGPPFSPPSSLPPSKSPLSKFPPSKSSGALCAGTSITFCSDMMLLFPLAIGRLRSSVLCRIRTRMPYPHRCAAGKRPVGGTSTTVPSVDSNKRPVLQLAEQSAEPVGRSYAILLRLFVTCRRIVLALDTSSSRFGPCGILKVLVTVPGLKRYLILTRRVVRVSLEEI